jgi:hypothetical protein
MILFRRSFIISAIWIGSCVLAAGLLWGLTQPIRTRALVQAANRVIARTGETRRLAAPAGRLSDFGTWFRLVEVPGNTAVEGLALVFTLMNGTRHFSCAALIRKDGSVETIIPLSEYAERELRILPETLYTMYAGRIKAAAVSSGVMGEW